MVYFCFHLTAALCFSQLPLTLHSNPSANLRSTNFKLGLQQRLKLRTTFQSTFRTNVTFENCYPHNRSSIFGELLPGQLTLQSLLS